MSMETKHRLLVGALQLAALFILGNCLAQQVNAETKVVKLPASYATFILNPNTGTLAAIDATSDKVDFFRQEDWQASVPRPHASIKVGKTPISIVHKSYRNKTYYVVVCAHSSNLFILTSDESDNKETNFRLEREHLLRRSGLSSVLGSANPEDPFVYFCHGSGQASRMDSFSLRDQSHSSNVLSQTMNVEVSADGNVIYSRSPWFPSTDRAMARSVGFDDKVPKFETYPSIHEVAGPNFPDPLNQLVFSSKHIYTQLLDRAVGIIDATSVCYFQSPPMIVGLWKSTLVPYSYNTYLPIGERLSLPHANQENEQHPQGVGSPQVFNRAGQSPALIAFPNGQKVLHADKDRLTIVDLADFHAPQERLLYGRLIGSSAFIVETSQQVRIEPLDPEVNVEIYDAPKGCVVDGNQITWAPKSDQIGEHWIEAKFSHSGIERFDQYLVHVGFTSTRLPFAPTGIEVTQDRKLAIIWQGYQWDWANKKLFSRNHRGSYPVAVVELSSGKVLAERSFQSGILQVAIGRELAYLRSNDGRIEAIKPSTLESSNPIGSDKSVRHIKTLEDLLLVLQDDSVLIYKQGETVPSAKFPVDQENSNRDQSLGELTDHSLRLRMVDEEGIRVRGRILNSKLQPTMLTAIPAEFVVGKSQPTTARLSKIPSQPVDPGLIDVQTSLGRMNVELWQNSRLIEDTRMSAYELLTVRATGTVSEVVIPITKYRVNLVPAGEYFRPSLCVSGDRIYVVRKNSLYQSNIPPSAEKERLVRLSRKQSHFLLAEGPQTILQHDVVSGNWPFAYELRSPVYNSFNLDQATGRLEIDNKAVRMQAAEFLGDLRVEKSRRDQWLQYVSKTLNLPFKGFPVAVEIQVAVTDANLSEDLVKYYIIVDVSEDEFRQARALKLK